MVFDLLGISLYDFMKENAFRPFELPEVQHFALQLMSALDYMHAHKLTHTDLKPENIMVDYPEKFRHKLSAGKLKYVHCLLTLYCKLYASNGADVNPLPFPPFVYMIFSPSPSPSPSLARACALSVVT